MKINNVRFTAQETNHILASLSYCIRHVIPDAPTVKDMRSAMKKLRRISGRRYRLLRDRILRTQAPQTKQITAREGVSGFGAKRLHRNIPSDNAAETNVQMKGGKK